MAKRKKKRMTRKELLATIERAVRKGSTELNLMAEGISELPDEIGQLTDLQTLDLSRNQLTSLPEAIGQLTNLRILSLEFNKLTSLPESIGQFINLKKFYCHDNQLTSLPESISKIGTLAAFLFGDNRIEQVPRWIGQLRDLEVLDLDGCQLSTVPKWISQLTRLKQLHLQRNQLSSVPDWIVQLVNLEELMLGNNQLAALPPSLAQLEELERLDLDGNPLNPALQSAYKAGLPEVMAYLRSLEEAEPLYEAKLVLVGEGDVGKTTLLKALRGREGEEPRKDEPTTHGVQIDIHALHLPHPGKEDVEIQLNAWDFGGQEVYRVTHQFFFSRRSLYLVVWEPRRGVGQCQVEDWLKLIRLRVGDDARVLIISTYCRTGEHIARIDEPVFERDFGAMIGGFHEVDSLVDDPDTGDKVGIAELKQLIADAAAGLEQMGMPFNRDWTAARDELLARPEPRISYQDFSAVCANHGLAPIDAETLAHLLHDLGYIVHYADDERLREDVILQAEWLTKAIGFVLEDRTTQEMDGILPDSRLHQVWHDHPFKGQTRYDSALYPFFLRLMEKYDVSYRLLEGTASLVAQHVPQVRPDLPWLPEQAPPGDRRRIAMICAMDDVPPGLMPWMIVRTHDYATELPGPGGEPHRLHWQKGMFLRHEPHGEAVLEQRGRELHVYAQAVWPEYFMNVLQHTLQQLITDNWPGLEGRYGFTVPCPERIGDQPCRGRFEIDALREFLAEGDLHYRCQKCRSRHSIAKLLFGFEHLDLSEQLRDIQARLDGLDSRIANYVMALMKAIAGEAKHGPRLFTIEPVDEGRRPAPRRLVSTRLRLRLWCEAEGCQHQVFDQGVGAYEFDKPREWVRQVAPYANFVLGLLKTVLPVAAPAADAYFGKDTVKEWDYAAHLDLAKGLVGRLCFVDAPPGQSDEIEIPARPDPRSGILNEAERSGLLAMHALLRELDPNHEKLGLTRVPTYTGDFRWLCREHYQEWEPKIPEVIEVSGS